MVKLVDYTPAWWSVSDLVLIHSWDSLVCDNCSQGVVTKRIIRAHALYRRESDRIYKSDRGHALLYRRSSFKRMPGGTWCAAPSCHNSRTKDVRSVCRTAGEEICWASRHRICMQTVLSALTILNKYQFMTPLNKHCQMICMVCSSNHL